MKPFPILIVALGLGALTARAADTLHVAAAISLKDALTDLAAPYQKATGDTVEFTYGSSGQLAAQIKNGAPLDAFISAANKQVDDLTADDLTLPDTRRVVAGNTLVLVIPPNAAVPDSFATLTDPAVTHLAIGEPKTVPAGQYATQTLEKLHLAPQLVGRIIYGSNVRQVLNYVERGEVSAGIVYATDAKASGDKVKVTATAPADSHKPVVYPAVVIKSSTHADAAKRFLDFLATDAARAALARKGFTPPPQQQQPATSQFTTRRAAP